MGKRTYFSFLLILLICPQLSDRDFVHLRRHSDYLAKMNKHCYVYNEINKYTKNKKKFARPKINIK